MRGAMGAEGRYGRGPMLMRGAKFQATGQQDGRTEKREEIHQEMM